MGGAYVLSNHPSMVLRHPVCNGGGGELCLLSPCSFNKVRCTSGLCIVHVWARSGCNLSLLVGV